MRMHSSAGPGGAIGLLCRCGLFLIAPASVQAQIPTPGLQFDGSNAWVGMGKAPGLGVSVFTIECWFNRLGPGVEASSGTGGVSGAPLVARGRGEVVADPRTCNYFLAIRSDRVLVADFHDTASGASHPVIGVTPIADNVWHHAAATYDGATWRLYLDGQLEAQLTAAATPRSAGSPHFSAGTAMNAAGMPSGAFHGLLDEIRVWNHARSIQQIQAGMQAEITQASGLLGRWGFNEGSGGFAGDAGPARAVGTIHQATWSTGRSFPAALRVATLASTSITDNAATLNGLLDHLGQSPSAQVYFRWGTAPNNLNRSTSPVTLTAALPFSRSLTGLTPGIPVYFRAVAGSANGTAEGAIFPLLPAENPGLALNGAGDFVSMGPAPALGAAAFTLECLFKQSGPGQTASTGSGGIEAVPLITKGRDEAEGGLRDCNYFLGIRPADGVLVADFEAIGSGQNHPVAGTTPITSDVWHHAAATYDGNTWRLFLDGNPDGESTAGASPQAGSIHHFGLGTALNTNGAPEGYFAGVLDEVRVWNHARTRPQLVSGMNAEISSGPGLIGRWGMQEGLGSITADTSGGQRTGFIASGTWAAGATFDINAAPYLPIPLIPRHEAVVAAGNVPLTVHISDPEADPLHVRFFGRTFHTPPPPPFSIVALPDTQFYAQDYPATFTAQTQWIVSHRDELNVAYVSHLGDIVHVASVHNQWVNADAALSLLDAIPDVALGLSAGNHDQDPNGDPEGTDAFNLWFPFTRYQNRPWYGGHFGPNNDNHYVLFTGAGIDYIAIHLEYDTAPNADVLSWAGNLLQTYAARRAIVVSHSIARVGDPAPWTAPGAAIYEALKSHSNLFLMLCGHISGESRRTDISAGTIHTLLSDYQSRQRGGDGWLRILQFVPADDVINVTTYSPTLNQYETDPDSRFSLPHAMGGIPFAELGTAGEQPSGADVSFTWSDRDPGPLFEWYAEVSDGHGVVRSPVQTFTTARPRCDLDEDGNVDDADVNLFLACTTGPDQLFNPLDPPPACTLVPIPGMDLKPDWDKDGDIDQEDFGTLQQCLASAGDPLDPLCLE